MTGAVLPVGCDSVVPVERVKIEHGQAQLAPDVRLEPWQNVHRRASDTRQGALLLRVADPFEMMRFRIKTGDGKVLQLTQRNPESRMVFLGYQYTFGRPPRVRQVEPDQTSGGSTGFGGPPGGGA